MGDTPRWRRHRGFFSEYTDAYKKYLERSEIWAHSEAFYGQGP